MYCIVIVYLYRYILIFVLSLLLHKTNSKAHTIQLHSLHCKYYCDREKHFRNCNLKNFGFCVWVVWIVQKHPLELLSENSGIWYALVNWRNFKRPRVENLNGKKIDVGNSSNSKYKREKLYTSDCYEQI